MDRKNIAYLRIHDFDCDISEISKALNLNPTDSWVKGDLIPNRRGNIRRKQSTWEYQSDVAQTEPIEVHAKNLLCLFEPKKVLLNELSEKYYTELTLVIHDYESCNPGFVLEATTIKKIFEMGLTIDVDIYVLIEKD